MIDHTPEEDVDSAREIGQMISDFRKEHLNKIHKDIEDEVDKIVSEGFDPAEGRGRGPLWAEGG